MAASGYSPISLYYSTTASATPTNTNLVNGELALNITDGKLFYKDNAGTVQTLATKAATSGSFSTTTISTSETLSYGTANGVAYLNGSKVVTTGSALTFDGTNLGVGLTPSGSFRLEIGGADGTQFAMRSTGTTSARIRGYVNSAESGVIGFLNGGGQYFEVAGSEGMRLTSTGLGIGTSSPGYKLQVTTNQNANTTIGVSNSTAGTSSVARFLALSDTANASFGVTSSLYTDITNAANAAYINSSGAGGIVLANGGVVQAKLDTSGNLGLGVTPSAWYSSYKALQVKTSALAAWGNNEVYLMSNAYGDTSSTYRYLATSSKATSYVQYEGTHIWNTAGTGTAGNLISFTQAMTLDASGSLLVGTTSSLGSNYLVQMAGGRASFAGNSDSLGLYLRYNTSTAGFFIGSPSANTLAFADSNATERARIDSSGNFLVAKTSNSATTVGGQMNVDGAITSARASSVNGDLTWYTYSTTAAAARFYVGMGGTVYATSTTITAISDQRLKENIQDLDVGLDKIMSLKPRKFDWKAGKGKDKKGDRGWIAQEFEQVFPDMIDTWADPAPEGEEPYKAVNADLIPVLVKAIQEQQALITQLTERITALEGK